MPAFLVGPLVSLALGFVIRALDKWQESIDWALVKADLAERVAKLLPGDFLDEAVVDVLNRLIDNVAAVLASTDAIRVVLELVAAKDLKGALEALRDLLLKHFIVEDVVLADLSTQEKDAILAKALEV
jgi:hypothetical protein